MSKRYEQEIEEILRHVEQATPREKHPDGNLKDNNPERSSTKRLRVMRWAITPGRLMIFSLVLGLLALAFRPFQSGLMDPLIWVAVLLFIFSYALFFIRPSSSYKKQWRGRPVEESTRSWLLRLREWLRNQ